ncbi:hypothetical protein Pryu01_00336 [Paraliobacillus ryukyuensis]|uniref:2,3-bisphosphoglycerate-dependent phosphoglycerate mutase n=1 Tax=Paraliobacillus ryukyuensis TaxID=200904 RepID=A0A366EGQ6_9BACI|nr:histidine phosphatase family protein [Paraliobacillus ryukyuensis]RBP01592.1 2,3-bisphosphoglycerate-dependent phosphoglycerate mutase [Paraliobacillus ryukyuensis]
MKQIILIRHCQVEEHHKDSPLTHHGVNQAHRLAAYFKEKGIRVDRIVTSPFMPAIETIKPFANASNIPIEKDVRLEERILSDEPIDDWLDVIETSVRDYDFSLSGGESSNEALRRGLESLNELWQDENHEIAAVVTHYNLFSLLVSHYADQFEFNDWKMLKTPDVFLIEQQQNAYQVTHLW